DYYCVIWHNNGWLF
nr:immunoglobulin light chain junction region [Macaca mulatta]MOX83739.1 immunoglobulin light chain junction region [Macaca mulatta]MOY05335.1 immunoglobulin light chain junction region [Macaca mulatta]MOY05798.1 immunoglobulin light chain junction region [Macaca mulatta]MOY06819.1 immunoglobulin light chain junction region [Macaca mulatta]